MIKSDPLASTSMQVPETESRRSAPPLAWYGSGWAYDEDETADSSSESSGTSGSLTPAQGFEPPEFGPETPPGQGRGLILGRFLPPHRGHQYLVDFARRFTTDLTLMLRVRPDDPISGALRTGWLNELFPNVHIVPMADRAPLYTVDVPGDDWAQRVREYMSGPPDYFFASESYGPEFAARLGSTYIPVDPERRAFPISGSAIRSEPFLHWDYLPSCVRPYYVRRICLIGPEGSGKSTLAKRLAERYDTVAVGEYARIVAEQQGGIWKAGDTQRIWRGQQAAEAALMREANRILFCDTDPLVVRLWSERRFGTAPEWMRLEQNWKPADLYMLTDSEPLDSNDPDSAAVMARADFLERCRTELATRGLPFIRLRDSWETRFARACTAVEDMLKKP